MVQRVRNGRRESIDGPHPNVVDHKVCVVISRATRINDVIRVLRVHRMSLSFTECREGLTQSPVVPPLQVEL